MKIKKLTAAITALLIALTGGMTAVADSNSVTFTDRQDNWNYPNAHEEFGSRNFLLDEDRQLLLDSLQNTEKFSLSKIWQMEASGICYGMSVTSILACHDIITPTLLGHPYAPHLSSVGSMPADNYDLTDTAKSAVNYYQTIQIADAARQHGARLMYHKTPEERLQYLLSCAEDDSPTLLTYSGYFGADTKSLHAVVAYGTEYGSWEYDGKTYDGRVLIYDPNIITLYDDACLYFNTEDWSWTIPDGDSDSDTCALTHITDDIKLINHAGLIGGTTYTSDEPFLGVLVTNALASDYRVSKAAAADHGWAYTNEPNTAMKEFDGFYIDAIDSAAVNFVTPDTDSGYVLDLQAPPELETAMYYEDCLQYIYAERGLQVVFTPDGYAAMASEGTDYKIEMVWNEGHYTGSWYDFSVSGNADTASLRKTADGYILTSDNLQDITVTAKNDVAQETLRFSADADSVLLCETDDSALTAKIDTDGDGIYETEVPEERIYGDFNADGHVDALDAVLILQYAAYAGAGGVMQFEEYLEMGAES